VSGETTAAVPGDGVPAAVGTALAEFLAEKRAALGTMAPELLPVADELAALCSAGPSPVGAALERAWRAHGGSAAGGEPAAAVVRVATALEVLRIADLAHREVMAAAGAPGVRVPERARVPLVADGVVLGADAGILVGDLALVWSEELLGRAGLTPAGLLRVTAVWDRMRTARTTGRYLELLAAAGGPPVPGDPDAGRASWTEELGAALAGATPV
jgi:geranylgeranyl diphosphate synthase, type I